MSRKEANRADILAIFAHPDDESWGCAGTLASYVAAGMDCRLLTATAGEAGFDRESVEKVPEDERMATRLQELSEAAEIIGLRDFEVLGLPDGGLERIGAAALGDTIGERIRDLRPRLVITFDETGITGHRDHMTVHRAVTEAFAEASPPGSRLVYNILPERVGARFAEAALDSGGEGSGAGFPFRKWSGPPPERDGSAGPFFVPDSKISASMDVREFVETKRAAILAHRSQVGEASFLSALDRGLLEAFFGFEYYQFGAGPPFRRAPAADLFDGME